MNYKYSNTIANKLVFFATIGEKYSVNDEDFEFIWAKIKKNKRKKRFKYNKLATGGYLIWRTL